MIKPFKFLLILIYLGTIVFWIHLGSKIKLWSIQIHHLSPRPKSVKIEKNDMNFLIFGEMTFAHYEKKK